MIGVRDTYVVTKSSDMGNLRIPRAFRQALEFPEASHWREAISKELHGLIVDATWTVVMLESELPRCANLMHCQMVFTVKRLADRSIEKLNCRLVADNNTQRLIL